MKLSIIIPAYNAGKTIERCLLSIVTQTFLDYEVLVIDDCSLDDTLSICKKLSVKYPQIKPLHQEKLGVSMARNLGIEHAVGDFLMFVDADDYLEPDCLGKIFKYIDNTDFNLDVVFFGTSVLSISGKRLHVSTFELEEIFDCKKFFVQFTNNSLAFGAPWGKLFNRLSVLNSGVRYNPKFRRGQDNVFNLNFARYCQRILTIPVIGYNYIHNINGTTLRFLGEDAIFCTDGIRSELKSYLVDYCGEKEALKSINNRYSFDYLYNIYPIYRSKGVEKRYYWFKRYWLAAEKTYPKFSYEFKTGIPKFIGILGRNSKLLCHLFLISIFNLEKLKHTLKKC